MEAPFRTALADLLRIAQEQNRRLLLVGAFARTLCLPESVRGPARKTRDADVAVQMEDWSAFDDFLSACPPTFTVDRTELRLGHAQTGVKIDVVPCGAIERPLGSLPLRRTTRILNTTGLSEAFSTARVEVVGGLSLLVPRPEAFVLLKLLSFLDRRAPRDLRDAGYVLHRYPADEDAVWEDAMIMAGFADESLAWEDLGVWQLGRALTETFQPSTVAVFLAALERLTLEPDATRALLVQEDGIDRLEPDARLLTADRIFDVLRRACRG